MINNYLFKEKNKDMKKNLFWMVAAALAFTGCSQDELMNEGDLPESGDAIAFSTYVGENAQSRATVVTTETLQTEGFGVNAWYTEGNDFATGSTYEAFMTNTKVTYDADKTAWTYSPLKYWPNNKGHKVSFFAYGPYNLPQSSSLTDEKTAINFTVENEVKEQVDLIYNTNYIEAMNRTKPAVNTRINFTFGHALSRISFSVEAAVDVVESNKDQSEKLDGNTVINVKRVALVDATAEDGSFELDENSYTGPFYTTGTLSLLEPENEGDSPWTIEEDVSTQGFLLDADNFYRTVTDATSGEVVQLHKFNQKQPLTNEESYLMVIPQDLRTAKDDGTSEGFKIYIEYDVITTDEDGTDHSIVENKIVSKDAMSVDFKQGMAYNFNLVLGMTSVEFDASVTEWTDADDYENEEWLPENIASTTFAYADGHILIKSADDLAMMRDLVNSGATYQLNESGDGVVTVSDSRSSSRTGEETAYAKASYMQEGNIDLGGVEWTPIGNTEYSFEGVYDGYTQTISNFVLNNSDENSYAGLFGYTSEATILNVKADNVTLKGTYVGAVAGYTLGGKIVNCELGSATCETDLANAAGIVYSISNTNVSSCVNNADITSSGDCGGIVCTGGGTIENCINRGDLTGNSVGGIIRYTTGKVIGCYNEGAINAKNNAAGIVQYATMATIEGSYNTGSVTAGYRAGGIVAFVDNETNITACYNTDAVSGTSTVGGIVGHVDVKCTLTACYNDGTISAEGDEAVAGGIIAGKKADGAEVTFSVCYFVSATDLKGCGYAESDDEGVTSVDGSTTTWEAATTAMNNVLTGWEYTSAEGAAPTVAAVVQSEAEGSEE